MRSICCPTARRRRGACMTSPPRRSFWTCAWRTPTAGWEVVAHLRHDPVLHATPVLVCSADLSALRERAADLERQGCTILAKPFDVDELLVLLQQLLHGAP